MDGKVEMLRHTVSTLAYRAAKALRGAPADFAGFRVAPGSRTPAEILAHMGDLFDWTLRMCDGSGEWTVAPVVAWDEEVARFFAALEAFEPAPDDRTAARHLSGEALSGSARRCVDAHRANRDAAAIGGA
ncbi:MAG: hypothetical protein WDO73_21855 [Ignavibacteriota bacterium]